LIFTEIEVQNMNRAKHLVKDEQNMSLTEFAQFQKSTFNSEMNIAKLAWKLTKL